MKLFIIPLNKHTQDAISMTANDAEPRNIMQDINDALARVSARIGRPATAIILGICFGIAFWSIPFFISANYVLLPEFFMILLLGLVTFFETWGSILSIIFFILGFIFGVLLLYSTSASASY
jgi:hypothetical protein